MAGLRFFYECHAGKVNEIINIVIRKMKTRLLSILCALQMSLSIQAHDLEPLHVDGRYLKNSKGDIVTLHGYMTVLEPSCQADEYRSTWDGYNVAMCLKTKKPPLMLFWNLDGRWTM